jgi:hypothetical protein
VAPIAFFVAAIHLRESFAPPALMLALFDATERRKSSEHHSSVMR